MNRLDVLAVGELNADLILSGREMAPEFGHDKPVDDYALTLGSSTALFAHGMARLGAKTGFVGVAGDDPFGRLVVAYLQRAGVDVSRVQLRPNLRTGLTVSLSEPGDRALMTYPGSIAALQLSDVDWEYVAAARHLHVASYFIQTGLRPQIPALLARAKEMGMSTSLDTGWDEEGAFGLDLLEALRFTDIFLPNREEALAITRQADITTALNLLAEQVHTVVVKLGAEGAIARRGREQRSVPAFRVEVSDTTGCGDAFDAGFVFATLQGHALAQSLTLGSACGALTATRLGGADGFPTLPGAAAFLRDNGVDADYLCQA
jgi:sugar/nucleoside kinase (ribokinase family)